MKKVTLCILLLVMIMSLTACDPNIFQFDFEELKNSVIAIDLINYDNPNAKELFDKRDKVISFDFNKMEILESLPAEKMEDFLFELSELTFMTVWEHLDSPQGKCIRLVYSNGDFEILACDVQYSGSFDSTGKVKRFIGSGLYYPKLINKYFETQV